MCVKFSSVTSLLLVISLLVFHGYASDDVYDFVIVGGGTAGCVLARRLSESGKHSVLVLEYGDYPDPGLETPVLQMEYLNDTNMKIYRTEQETNGGLSNNGVFNYMIGRMLGGTSGLNGMAFNRGSPYSYNEWARITGDSSWNYSSVLKYFRKLEDYQGGFPSNTEHGTGGPITVSRSKYTPGLDQWLEAGAYLGYPIADPNGPQRPCFAPLEYSKRSGRRVSSFSGYIQPLLSSRQLSNLKIIVKAEVKKIILEGSRTVGVIYEDRGAPGRSIFVRANKEVIVSAGVINSPLILMKSGIGPRGVLQASNIPVLASLPVGRNLHDHLVLGLSMILGNSSATMIPQRDLNADTWKLYNEIGDGPYSVFPGTPGQAFLVSSRSSHSDLADMQIVLGGSPASGAVLTARVQDVQLAPGEVRVFFALVLNVPRSRGYLTLNPLHPEEGDPTINFRYLSHPDDIKILTEGIKTAIKIFEDTPVYRRMGARYPPEPTPECAHLKFRSDPYWECVINYTAGSGSHAVGTCSMGKGIGDPDSVVGPNLKVVGFQNLRVVDASVIPMVTNANTMAAVYVVAEKAADMILSDWI